jgi:hypothetical protein
LSNSNCKCACSGNNFIYIYPVKKDFSEVRISEEKS